MLPAINLSIFSRLSILFLVCALHSSLPSFWDEKPLCLTTFSSGGRSLIFMATGTGPAKSGRGANGCGLIILGLIWLRPLGDFDASPFLSVTFALSLNSSLRMSFYFWFNIVLKRAQRKNAFCLKCLHGCSFSANMRHAASFTEAFHVFFFHC